MISFTSTLAENVSSKVRQLDVAKVRAVRQTDFHGQNYDCYTMIFDLCWTWILGQNRHKLMFCTCGPVVCHTGGAVISVCNNNMLRYKELKIMCCQWVWPLYKSVKTWKSKLCACVYVLMHICLCIYILMAWHTPHDRESTRLLQANSSRLWAVDFYLPLPILISAK